MKVKLHFFAGLRDYFKSAGRETELASPRTVQEIFFDLFEDKELAGRMARSIRFAVNLEYVDPETIVREGDEIAFIPPISGG